MIWAKILAGLVSFAQMIAGMLEAAQQRKAGADAERLKVMEAEDEIENTPVNPISRDDLIDRLRGGGF